ncbi:MAG: nuclear transport factor 2 family protein [Rhodospirillales bacterium]|nr:nuclear transport factor 2 family protein [Rhodospirillales bacterium]
MTIETLNDELEIKRLRERWAFGRDYSEWDEIAACFHEGATVNISWYQGDVAGFIEGSKKLIAKYKPEERGKHWLGNSRIWVKGGRAVAEVDAQVLSRKYLEGYLFDFTAWARFYDLVEKRDGVWKITQWKMIYDADRMDAVEPGKVPQSFYEGIDLTPYPRGCAHLCHRLNLAGRSSMDNIISINTPEEAETKAEGERWLAGT